MSVTLCILAEKPSDADYITEKARGYVDHILVSTRPVKDFSEARNSLATQSEDDYLLWWDTDEDYPIEFLKNLKTILKERPALCYRFLRINPDMSGYPDYQVRLFRRAECRWERPVHEIVVHLTGKPADQIDCITLNEYPIVHYAGTLHKRVLRFQRNMHILARSLGIEELLREVDAFAYEVVSRYKDQPCKIKEGEQC